MSMSFFKNNPTIFRRGFTIVCLVILAISLLPAAPTAALPPRPDVGGNSTPGSGGVVEVTAQLTALTSNSISDRGNLTYGR